jgi:glycosyltransferase involved in cell wall biosynthesis
MLVGIDLRGLNYGVFTGVNTYTVHMLYALTQIRARHDLQFISIGLNPEVRSFLSSQYEFFDTLFVNHLSVGKYYGFKNTRLSQNLWSVFTLLKLTLTNNLSQSSCFPFDLLILPQPKPLLKNQSTKLLTVFHDIFGVINDSTMSWKQKLLENKFCYKTLADASSVIFANSFSTANDLVYHLDTQKNKINLVYPGNPLISAPNEARGRSSKNNIGIHRKFMLSVSGIEPRKNWLNILKAFQFNQLNSENFDYDLVFAGRVVNREYYNELTSFINNNKIKRVYFYLDLIESEKKLLYKNCDFVLYPSFYEGFGFPILEAFSFGKPVITSKISSMPELGREGAIYVNPLNYLDIASAMRILEKDRVYYEKLVKYIIKNDTKYTWKELELALKKVLEVDET